MTPINRPINRLLTADRVADQLTMFALGKLEIPELYGLFSTIFSYVGFDVSRYSSSYKDPSALELFQSYLQIRTDHPDPAYDEALRFLTDRCKELNISTQRLEFEPGKPLLLATIPGKDTTLPSIIFNSHTDVVPAEPSKWLPKADPFQGSVLFRGGQRRIYARGSQDMKSVGIQYLIAVKNLLSEGWRPLRTIYLLFVPDEEIGGMAGMGNFVASDVFKKLNVGMEVDEGLPTEGNYFRLFFGERRPWWLSIKVEGQPGHGATLPEMTPSMRLHSILDKALKFRKEQLEKTIKNGVDIGDTCGVNLVFMKAGTPNDRFSSGFIMNLIPSTAEAGLDIRVPPAISGPEMEKVIETWLACPNGKRCPGVTYSFSHKVEVRTTTSLDVAQSVYAKSFLDAMKELGINVRQSIFPAATDARFFRELNIPSFGFSPIRKTPNLLHDHNEYLPESVFFEGIKVYEKIFKHLGDAPRSVKKDDETAKSEL